MDDLLFNWYDDETDDFNQCDDLNDYFSIEDENDSKKDQMIDERNISEQALRDNRNEDLSFLITKCKETNSFLPPIDQLNKKTRKEIFKLIGKPIYKPHCKWSKEEDEKLKELVKEYGENDWRHLAKKFEGRNSRQCRERWNYYLNPRLKQGKWTIEEDLKILEKYNQLGPRWMEISKYFESRTDAMIKNRYHYLIRNKKCQDTKFIDTNINIDHGFNFHSIISNECQHTLLTAFIDENSLDYFPNLNNGNDSNDQESFNLFNTF